MSTAAPPTHKGTEPLWLGDPADREFMRDALCRSLDADYADRLFFSDGLSRDEKRRAILHAQNICINCPVMEQCQNYALTTHSDFGIWGGLTEDDRAKLTNHRGRRARASV